MNRTNVLQHTRPDRDMDEAATSARYHCSRRYLLGMLAIQMATVAIVATAVSEAGLPLAAVALTVMTPVPLGIFFAKLNYRFELTELAIETVKPLSPRLTTITPLKNVCEVNTRAGVFETLLGAGTIVMTTLGGRLTWPHLPNHREVAERILERKSDSTQ